MCIFPGFNVQEKYHNQVDSRQEENRVILDFNIQIFICSKRVENIVLFVVLLYFSTGFRVHKKNHKQVESRG